MNSSGDSTAAADLFPWRITVELELRRIVDHEPDKIIQRTPTDRRKFRDFLSGESQLFGSVLEKRIKAFIANGTWGELSEEQDFYLILRLKLAALVLDAMIRNEAPEQLAAIPKPPKPSNASEFWRWLLIGTWAVLGEDYLMNWVDDSFEKSGNAALIKEGALPYGIPAPNMPGFVKSPYAPGYVDVRRFKPGSEIEDPFTKKRFLVP